MTTLNIPTAEVFEPLLKPSRYKGAHGGRGSGKSHFFGGLVTEEHATIPGHRTVCIREVQKSIKLSSKQLIVDKINQFNLNHLFDVQDQQIKTPKDGVIVFQGLQNHTAESIKSLEGFDRAWVEEAQSISKYSWDMLRPTFRKPGSEIWASWNPLMEEDAIDKFFRGEGSDRPDMQTVQANWSDNPWFKSGTLPEERIEDLRARPDDYDWIWEGAYRTVSEAAIFRNKFEITEFETPDDAIFFHGADWGYANDPTTLIRMYILNECLYIDAECYSTGIELDDLPRFFDAIPTARKWPIRADAAAPQIISYVRRQGFNISAAKKWPKSVEEGIAYLRGFKKIYIHRRCVHTAKEFRSYSWKTDRHSGVLVPVPEDANNHAIDACVAEGELISTLRGQIPVEDVTEKDFVQTRCGYRRVKKAWVSGQMKEVWEVQTNLRSVWLTPNHLVWTEEKGFVRVDALEYGDTLIIGSSPKWENIKQRFSSIKGKLSGAIRQVLTSAMHLISK